MTIGLDLGDKTSRYCGLDRDGEQREEGSVATTKKAFTEKFAGMKRCRIAIEVGTHSPWVSRVLKSMGHEVIVANARQVRLITHRSRKNDRMDARTPARLARIDPGLLSPIRHRSEQAQQHLAMIRVRAALVEARTKLVNAARGFSKAQGERLPACDAGALGVEEMAELPAGLQAVLRPLLEQGESLSEKIHQADVPLEQIARTEYPETALLRQVQGVGVLIALTFVLTLDDRERFHKSRDAGCYVGLRPRQRDSGESQPQLGISKEGDRYASGRRTFHAQLRTLLVQGAHPIPGWRGPDTDLRRWGLQLAARGGNNGKKRAIVAVARKLAVLLHRLWVTGEVYEPLRHGGTPIQQAA
jgi:transposase